MACRPSSHPLFDILYLPGKPGDPHRQGGKRSDHGRPDDLESTPKMTSGPGVEVVTGSGPGPRAWSRVAISMVLYRPSRSRAGAGSDEGETSPSRSQSGWPWRKYAPTPACLACTSDDHVPL